MARRVAAALAALLAAGASLTACGGGGGSALGKQACSDAARSLRLYAAAARLPAARAASERRRALGELRLALAPAAQASTNGGSWQALAATLEESSRVPERELVTALAEQCSLAPNGS